MLMLEQKFLWVRKTSVPFNSHRNTPGECGKKCPMQEIRARTKYKVNKQRKEAEVEECVEVCELP
jgi:hypothetical protein